MIPALRRTGATLRLNIGRQARGGFWLVALAVGVLNAALIRALPQGPGPWWPVIILAELAVTGFYFAAVQVLLEQAEGTLAARAVTPMRPAEYLVALVVSLVGLALAESVALVLIGHAGGMQWAALAAGVTFLSSLYVLYGVIAVAEYDSIGGFLLPSGVWTLVLIVPALPLLGLPGGWWLWLHPLQGAFTLIQLGFGQARPQAALPATLAASAWLCGVLVLARHRLAGIAAGSRGRSWHRP